MAEYNKYDTEDRLVDFTFQISEIVEILPDSRMGNHIAGQLVKCGSSPALNYSEEQSAASRMILLIR